MYYGEFPFNIEKLANGILSPLIENNKAILEYT